MASANRRQGSSKVKAYFILLAQIAILSTYFSLSLSGKHSASSITVPASVYHYDDHRVNDHYNVESLHHNGDPHVESAVMYARYVHDHIERSTSLATTSEANNRHSTESSNGHLEESKGSSTPLRGFTVFDPLGLSSGSPATSASYYKPARVDSSEECVDRQGVKQSNGTCVCGTLFSGPRCERGDIWEFDDAAPKRMIPLAFTGDIVMNQKFLKKNPDIRIHLPGKEPPWRTIGKAKSIMDLTPDTDPLRSDKLYRSCAVVGNSGVLLNEKQGAVIDAHDMVMRFNGAQTKGLEEYVGAKTTYRLVNSKWTEGTRESKSETMLWNMRAAGALDFYKERVSANKKEKFYMFSSDFVNYVGQTAIELSKSFTGADAEGFESDTGFTPTSGLTGFLIAINLCHKVKLYGVMISEAQGFPYHYHNRCPQPYAARDMAEWLLFHRFVSTGLASFNEPCVVECRSSPTECDECRTLHPEVYDEEVTAQAREVWEKMPMPDYCSQRAEMLRREKEALANGDAPWSKEKRDAVLKEISGGGKSSQDKQDKKAKKREDNERGQ